MGLRLWSAPVDVPPEPASAAEIAQPAPGPAPGPVPGRKASAGAPPARPAEIAAAVVPGPVRSPAMTRTSEPPKITEPAAPAAVLPAPAPAVAGMGWDALRETVAACRACALCEGRRQAVFGTGHPGAAWLVVGEAPGEEEDRRGEPFVGASGQLLERMLAALALSRAADGDLPAARRVYIANAVKCRPPGNRNPVPEELKRCEPYLARQIELLRPRLILAMGRFAVRSLLHSDEPIGRLRGRVHQCRGLPLVVTYHPSYLLRNPHEKAKAWDDLCLAADTFEASEAAAGQGA